MLLGTGLVETVEDFGIQGALPTHPELLDWLATELVRRNWNTRACSGRSSFRQRTASPPARLRSSSNGIRGIGSSREARGIGSPRKRSATTPWRSAVCLWNESADRA